MESFEWILEPEDGVVTGTIYPDGSLIDAADARTARLGWAFVAVDDTGTIVAAARGVPPGWITTIPGAEVWAFHMAVRHALPGAKIRPDCLAVEQTFQHGKAWATAPERPLARVWVLIFACVDDAPDSVDLSWMPAHTTEADVGRARLSNGQLLTTVDRTANAAADSHAKQAAREVRVPLEVRRRVDKAALEVYYIAKWLGVVTARANGMPSTPERDAESTLARRRRTGEQRPRRVRARTPPPPRPVQLGGHDAVWSGHDWVCRVCRYRSRKRGPFLRQRCSGSAAVRWAERAETLRASGATDGGGHTRFLTDDVLWCDRCGAYAISQAIGLAKPCSGKPTGGTLARLGLLRRGLHPVTRDPLPADPVPEPRAGVPLRPQRSAALVQDGAFGPLHLPGPEVPDATESTSEQTPSRLQTVRERILMRIRAQSAN